MAIETRVHEDGDKERDKVSRIHRTQLLAAFSFPLSFPVALKLRQRTPTQTSLSRHPTIMQIADFGNLNAKNVRK